MAELGCFLSSEEHGPQALVATARAAEEAGFPSVLISDHYHPWIDRQGQSPFVWSVIGGIAATTRLRVTTGVTCPTVRIHPAILAQASATAQLMLEGRFIFGVGTGENLNEHVLGDRWPPADVRLEMLEEAVEVLRGLWRGQTYNHHGPHYTVENARIYSVPEQPPPILVSGFGPKAMEVAARIGDGFVTVAPDPGAVARYRDQGGRGPTVAAVKVCWGEDEASARKLAHDRWPTSCVPGQLNQELSMPAHFEQATEPVTEDMVAEQIPCGPDPERHAQVIHEYLDAGFDQIYVSQVGDDQLGFFDFFRREVQPRLGV
ncbi:MAG TPA: TIGR03557 family F420-dependent LLM class oxidoreductase [Acidimicrobiales bacterium]|nr:TIGR03557 family F420-dependent LLM class oxidoreductase [Acidimicrobiales bacterium]